MVLDVVVVVVVVLVSRCYIRSNTNSCTVGFEQRMCIPVSTVEN